jgi:putative DNA methylase
VIENGGYRFTVKVGKPNDAEAAKNGTKLGRGANFRCLMSGTPIAGDYIKAEGKAGRMGARMMAIVAEGERGRVYLAPTTEHEAAARRATPEWKPDVEFFQQALGFRIGNYGMTRWSDLFTNRQLVALATLSGLVQKAREQVFQHAEADAAHASKRRPASAGGEGADPYGDAVSVYPGFVVDRSSDFWRSLSIGANQPKNELVGHVFGRQALPMTWGFGEVNIFSGSGGSFLNNLEYVAKGWSCECGTAWNGRPS